MSPDAGGIDDGDQALRRVRQHPPRYLDDPQAPFHPHEGLEEALHRGQARIHVQAPFGDPLAIHREGEKILVEREPQPRQFLVGHEVEEIAFGQPFGIVRIEGACLMGNGEAAVARQTIARDQGGVA